MFNFNWFLSKSQPVKCTPLQNSSESAKTAGKQAPIKIAKPEIQTKSTSYASYIPGAQWLMGKARFFKEPVVNSSATYYLSQICKAIPRIGLTGSGISIGGINLSLRNIPTNSQNALRFFAALSMVATAKADELISHYFTDPSGQAHYQLAIANSRWDTANIMNAITSTAGCNGTLSTTPFPLTFNNMISQWLGAYGPTDVVTAVFSGVIGEARKTSFENCVIDTMPHDYEEVDVIGNVLWGFTIAAVGTCIAYGTYNYIKEKCCAPNHGSQQPLLGPNQI